MSKKRKLQLRFPAVSLVEVLVVLMLVATTMVAASQITITALVKIKENEVDDYVNGLMVQVLEAAKSPQVLSVDNSLTQLDKFEGGYILEIPEESFQPQAGEDGTTVGLRPTFKQQSIDMQRIAVKDCSDKSPNYVRLPNLGAFTPPPVCLQALVDELSGIKSTSVLYEVTVRAVYNLASGPVERELIGYRRADPTTASLPVAPLPPPPPPPPPPCVDALVPSIPAFNIGGPGNSYPESRTPKTAGPYQMCADNPAFTKVATDKSGSLDDLLVLTSGAKVLKPCGVPHASGAKYCYMIPTPAIAIVPTDGALDGDGTVFCYKGEVNGVWAVRCTKVCNEASKCKISHIKNLGVPTKKFGDAITIAELTQLGFVSANKINLRLTFIASGSGWVNAKFRLN